MEIPRYLNFEILRKNIPNKRLVVGVLSLAALISLGIVTSGCDNSLLEGEYVKEWDALMIRKFEDPIHNLDFVKGEEFYPHVRVNAAGLTLADQLQMRSTGTPVNVRDLPFTNDDEGNRSQILGTIAQGTDIYNVIFTNGRQPESSKPGIWAAFQPDSAKVKWNNPNSKPRIVVIYGIYADPVGK